ncbi:MAG: N-acetylmuramoyl-L-alanine amidase [Bdellovibrionales bacterium]|nr:N-acetylmuramoyl-L-alanine amidase [Bdellovibrionales bacterium]
MFLVFIYSALIIVPFISVSTEASIAERTKFSKDLASKKRNFRVFVDPGHGGVDAGATSQTIKESDITFDIAQELVTLLSKGSVSVSTQISHAENEYVAPEQRLQRAQKFKADILISIHVNWSKDLTAKGMEIYFQNQLPPDQDSLYLAHRESELGHKGVENHNLPSANLLPTVVSTEVRAIIGDLFKNQQLYQSSRLAIALKKNWQGQSPVRSIRQLPFIVVSYPEIPSVLVEVGFLSHTEEFKLLTSPSYQKRVAKNLFDGIIHYYENEIMDK